MCGIVGFTGTHQAAPILLDGLSKLEYRGYDSAGIAVRNGDRRDRLSIKAKGTLESALLRRRTTVMLCRVRAVSVIHVGQPMVNLPNSNAHPHVSDDGNVVAVFTTALSRTIRNLKKNSRERATSFYSDTDTEVAVKLIDYYYKKYEGTPVDAINHSMVRIRGSYALAVMFKDYPEEIYVARKDSPMILGVDKW